MKSIKKSFDISIIIVTYNADWNKLKETLDSIIKQESVSLEIIIADDGSIVNHNSELIEYFSEKSVSNYKMIMNDKNRGTVCNLISGVEVATGEFVKCISPGDALLRTDTLSKWIKFMDVNDLIWSFSDSIYYKNIDGKKEILKCMAHPNDIKPYIMGKFNKCRWNYVVLDDIALGAAVICKTDIEYQYLKIIENKVKYAEDNIWRLMMFDGVRCKYYQDNTMWYEYGEGVSTSNNSMWLKRLSNDWENTSQIILNTSVNEIDSFQKSIIKNIRLNQNKFFKIFIKGKVVAALKKKLISRKTVNSLPLNSKYIN